MPSFYKLFLSIVGHVSAPRSFRVTHAASADGKAGTRPRRGRKGQAPPVFHGDNRLRRDIGLPPIDHRGLPM
ncbi:MAG TPA: hypothetical protein VH184_09710 [Dongiaceae bacterium]|nr:hypothetical protein [Dongiaceae bacterium]